MSGDIWVSPKYTLDDLNAGKVDLVTVFENKVTGWTLDHADLLASKANPNGRHAGFAILMLCTAYFESIEAFTQGKSSKGHSGEFFRLGFLRVFPNIGSGRLSTTERDDLVNSIYDEIRNGLYHQMNVKSRVAITRSGTAIDFLLDAAKKPQVIVLDPWEILEEIKRHFADVMKSLRDPVQTKLRTDFTTYFNATRTAPGVSFTVLGAGAKSTR
jgi:hypothetical protein